MQELEKILEEIDNLYVDETDFGIECNMENRSDVACDNCYECIKEACKNIIRKHTNDGWVSVEERLPEYGKKVLAYGKSGEIDIASLYSRDKHMWLVGSMCSVAFDIIAWRTLPEPYCPERSDK